MTETQAMWLIAGALAAGALIYLATKRDIFVTATVTADEPSITYPSFSQEHDL